MQLENKLYKPLLNWLQIVFFGVVILYFGRAILVPLSFSLLIALILYPSCTWLEKHRWPRSLAISFLLLLVAILFSAVIGLLFWQLSFLKEDTPALIEKLKVTFEQFQRWLSESMGFSISSVTSFLQGKDSGNSIQSIVQTTIEYLGNFLFSLFLIPVFTALFLYNREQFMQALKALIPQKNHERLMLLTHKSTFAYSNYIIGLLKVYIIVGILNSLGLLLLGIDNAILFGMLTAIMTMIPYVGIIVSALLPITVAWLTKDSILYPLGVVAVFTFVQYLENSVIFPRVVGKQLNVSTWAILVALLAGGLLWGVAGMVLFMPFVAILKIISDDVEEWKALNILLSRDLQ